MAMLFQEQSSDKVLNILNSAGLTGISATGNDAYSHSTRKRAYKEQLSTTLKSLSTEERHRTAELVIKGLVQNDESLLQEVNDSLGSIGWTFQKQRLYPLEQSAQEQEAFFRKGEAHDAYVHIRGIIQSATSAVFVVDPYVDDSIYMLFKTVEQERIAIQVLGRARSLSKDFSLEGDKFFQQHTNVSSFDARTTDDIHDRFIVIDHNRVYLLGASIKDAGKKAFAILPIEQGRIVDFILRYLTEVWDSSATVWGDRR